MVEEKNTEVVRKEGGALDNRVSNSPAARIAEESIALVGGLATGIAAYKNVGSILPKDYSQDKSLRASTTAATASAAYTLLKMGFRELASYIKRKD